MSVHAKRLTKLFTLLACMPLQWAAHEVRADLAVLDCGIHRTDPVKNANGSVTYPGEHTFPATIALNKGDNLGLLATRESEIENDQFSPVNGWIYLYRPDGRLLACTRNDATGSMVMSLRSVPDTGNYYARFVTLEPNAFKLKAVKWTDAHAALTSRNPYAFSQFFPAQEAIFTVDIPKAGSNLTVAFDDHNRSNAFLQIKGPYGHVGMVDLGSTGYKVPVNNAGTYTITLIPKSGTRLRGSLVAIVD